MWWRTNDIVFFLLLLQHININTIIFGLYGIDTFHPKELSEATNTIRSLNLCDQNIFLVFSLINNGTKEPQENCRLRSSILGNSQYEADCSETVTELKIKSFDVYRKATRFYTKIHLNNRIIF